MSKEQALEQLNALVGKEVHTSDWLDISQERIDAFATATKYSSCLRSILGKKAGAVLGGRYVILF